jgi:hypothetical protein
MPYIDVIMLSVMDTDGLRLPNDLKETAAAQADAQGEAERYFATRAARAKRGRAKEVLALSGIGIPPRPDDLIEE